MCCGSHQRHNFLHCPRDLEWKQGLSCMRPWRCLTLLNRHPVRAVEFAHTRQCGSGSTVDIGHGHGVYDIAAARAAGKGKGTLPIACLGIQGGARAAVGDRRRDRAENIIADKEQVVACAVAHRTTARNTAISTSAITPRQIGLEDALAASRLFASRARPGTKGFFE